MYRIVTKRPLHETVTLMEVEAPYIAKKAKPGQFIILQVNQAIGERIPLTIADADAAKGLLQPDVEIADPGIDRLPCPGHPAAVKDHQGQHGGHDGLWAKNLPQRLHVVRRGGLVGRGLRCGHAGGALACGGYRLKRG